MEQIKLLIFLLGRGKRDVAGQLEKFEHQSVCHRCRRRRIGGNRDAGRLVESGVHALVHWLVRVPVIPRVRVHLPRDLDRLRQQ